MKEGIKSSTHPTAVGVTEVYPGEVYIYAVGIVYYLYNSARIASDVQTACKYYHALFYGVFV
jgi:hypothetical protein